MNIENILHYFSENWKLMLFLLLVYGFYYYCTYTFDYFEKKGVSYIKPRFYVGSVWKRVSREMSFHEFQLYVYDYFKGKPYGGIFEGRRPTLYVFDPEVIKTITVRDFEYFVDRNSLKSNEPRYLQRSLLNLKGAEWKMVRSIITPSFSSARLKNMMPLIQQTSDQMVKFLEHYDKNEVEMKDVSGHLTLAVIGACAFGIKSDALTVQNAHFVKLAENFGYLTTPRKIILMTYIMLLPTLLKYVNVSFVNREVVRELVKILKVTKAERRKAESNKNDFLQLLINAANKEQEETGAIIHMDDDTIDAQSFLFLVAGYETSSTLLSYAVHALAIYPDIQDKVREHILKVTNEKEITYELLSELTYLEGFIFESLRINPPLGRVERQCTKEYILPGNVKVGVGDVIGIPVYGIHMDPEIYPDPHEFRPERFIGDEKKNRPSHLYLAFGSGPRNCIGMRFAMVSAKISLVTLVKNYKFFPCARTENPVKAAKDFILLKPATGIWVKIEKI